MHRVLGSIAFAFACMAQAAPEALPRLTPLPESASDRIDLGGTWHFNPAPPARFPEEPGDGWRPVEVPGEWVLQGFAVERGKAAGYLLRVDVPSDWQGRRIKLRFDAVYSEAEVWVNGRRAGAHEGGFTPFELDITGLAQPGAAATIAAAVRCEGLADELASGTQYAAHPLGGITRKVTLFSVPGANIASLHVETRFDGDFRDATLAVLLDVANAGARPAREMRVRVDLVDPEGRSVPFEPSAVPLPAVEPGEVLPQRLEFPIAAPQKWDPEHPNLYTLACTLEEGGRPVQTVRRRVGFRQVEVRGDRLLVNGIPVKLRGSCRHEVHPLRGRSLTPGLWRRDAELFRAANVNYIRTSHYPPAEEFIEACDELGLFVEEEAPLCWIGHPAGNDPLQKQVPETRIQELVVRQTLEMIARDRSHPSVIAWSLANESLWGPAFEESLRQAGAADPSRPTSFHDQAWGDFNSGSRGRAPIANYHYPTPAEGAKPDERGRPLLFGEYCHLNCYNREELATDPGARDAWGRILAPMWETMYATPGCVGGALWAGIDDIFELPSGEAVGYGAWGFIDGWRREKPEYWHVKKVYSPIRVAEDRLALPEAGQPLVVRVSNRHDFTNLGELTIDWELRDAKGAVERGTVSGVDIPPHGDGLLSITPASAPLERKKLALRFTSPRGFVVDEYLLPIGPEASAEPGFPPFPAGKLAEDADTLTLSTESVSWTLDKRTRAIRATVAGGRETAIGEPQLMLLPLRASKGAPEHRADIPPFNDTCHHWTVSAVEARRGDGGPAIAVRGRCDEAEGEYTLALDAEGRLVLQYRFAVLQEIDPRQIGLVFDLPREFTELAWKRRTQWSVYPDDHIGRPEGVARAFPETPATEPRRAPTHPWALDANSLGSNDFRSTKERIEYAALRVPGNSGPGVRVLSDGKQAVRAWIDGDRVRLLVAGYSNAGGEPFQRSHSDPERHPLKPGDTVSDTVRLAAP